MLFNILRFQRKSLHNENDTKYVTIVFKISVRFRTDRIFLWVIRKLFESKSL